MWVISCFDRTTENCIKAIHGHELARKISYFLDRLATQTTTVIDTITTRANRYHRANLDEETPDNIDSIPVAEIGRARLFRRKYVLPRRRLTNREGGCLRWEQLEPGEDTSRSRTYQECDVPLSSLTEFGEGWVLYFWTLKMIGFVSALALLLVVPAWHWAEKIRAKKPDSKEQGTILNFILSRFASFECADYAMVCMDEVCSDLGIKHLCPEPHHAHALSCILVMALYAMLIINLRWTQSETSNYVKSLEAKNSLNTEDYSVMVENPPADASSPNEWYQFFSQFGSIAYITVAKDDSDLVYKCFEPRTLMLQLYLDNPTALRDKISVLGDDPGQMNRKFHSFVSAVAKDDIFAKKSSTSFDGEIDAGDADAGGSADDTIVQMAPWCTGGHLRLATETITLADDLEKEGAEQSNRLKLTTLQGSFEIYYNPFVFWRRIVFGLKTAFPHFFGTLSQQDRDMIAERLFVECPREMKDELKKLNEGKQYSAVRIFVIFETIKGRRECLDTLTAGGLLRAFVDARRADIPINFKFRGEKILNVSHPPAPEQVIWHKLQVSFWQRKKDDIFSVLITFLLILVAYNVALWSSTTAELEESSHTVNNTPEYLRSFGFGIWAQIFNQLCTQTFGWLASQENHHDEDAKQLSLLLRYSLLKCITSIIFIFVTPQVHTLYTFNIAAMKTMLCADAVIGPLWRYIDILSLIKRFLSRFLPNQALMDWAHLSPAHDIADSYSNIVKTVFLGLFVLALIPSSPVFTALACLTGYWVDKHAICRVWSCHAHSKPAKYTAQAVQYLLGIALVAAMMQTVQLYKNWPFDNLCKNGDSVVKNAAIWQGAKAMDGQVWGPCIIHASSRSDSIALWASPQPWMSVEHAQALRIYSIGSVMITLALALYFWGRGAVNLVYSLFCTNTVPPREDEDNLPLFSQKRSGHSAYIPQVKDSKFMFPLLATDLSLMGTRHIPWQCNYERTNLARDIGDEATQQGLIHAFSVVKRYSDEVLPGVDVRTSTDSSTSSISTWSAPPSPPPAVGSAEAI